MKKIVKGNDFTLRIPVAKMVEGATKGFPSASLYGRGGTGMQSVQAHPSCV